MPGSGAERPQGRVDLGVAPPSWLGNMREDPCRMPVAHLAYAGAGGGRVPQSAAMARAGFGRGTSVTLSPGLNVATASLSICARTVSPDSVTACRRPVEPRKLAVTTVARPAGSAVTAMDSGRISTNAAPRCTEPGSRGTQVPSTPT